MSETQEKVVKTEGETKRQPRKNKRVKFRRIPTEEVLSVVGTVQSSPSFGPGSHNLKPRKLEGADAVYTLK